MKLWQNNVMKIANKKMLPLEMVALSKRWKEYLEED